MKREITIDLAALKNTLDLKMTQEFPVINSTLSAAKLCEVIQNKYNLSESTDCKLFRAAINHLYNTGQIYF